MIDWKTYFTKDIKNWLLEDNNPSVRYFTMVELLEKSEQSKEVQFAKKLIMETGPVKRILSNQNPDGSFLTEAMKKQKMIIDYRFGYQPKYKGTIWQLLFLAQLGVEKNDRRIKNLCKYILKTNYLPKHQLIGLKFKGGGMFKTTIPCYVSNMVWGLSKLGFYGDYRVQNSIKWLLKYQRFDDGDFKTPNEWPYRGKADRCFGKHSCHIGCTQALKAMTVIPKNVRTEEINSFVQKAIDYILLHKIYKRSRGKNQLIRKEYEFLAFPSFYYDDVIEILNSLLFFNIKDQAINEAIDFILSKRPRSGKWILERTIRPSAMHAKFEEKGQESKWITFRVLRVLKTYYEINSSVA